MLVKAPFAVRPVGAGGIVRSPGSSSGGFIPSVAPTAVFPTFTMLASCNSRRVTALSKGSPRCPNLISNASFIVSSAIFSSRSVLGGIFFIAGTFAPLVPIKHSLVHLGYPL